MWSRFLIVLVLTLGVSPLLAAPAAHACSCASELSDAQFATYADTIFEGTVTQDGRNERSSDQVRMTFAVTTVHKGTAFARQPVSTSNSGASCGLEITGTGPFLVFAEREGKGVPQASLCGGTREVSVKPVSFGAGSAPTAGTDPAADRSIRDRAPAAAAWAGGLGLLALAFRAFRRRYR